MLRRPGWKDLSVGLFALAAIAAVALSILVYARPGRLRGKTITVYATADAARGVISGTEVWLEGQKIGVVKNVSFQPPTVDPRERLIITMDVLDGARANLRRDSRVDIRSGMSIIGDQVVYLSNGTPRAPEVANGDTIHGGQQSDMEEATSEVTLASREFPAIIANVQLLAAQLQTAQGTLGAFGVDMHAPEMLSIRVRSTRLLSRIFNGGGTIALTMNGSSALRARAALAMAQADSIRALLASNDHSLGRFRRDSTLMLDVQQVRTELANVQRLAASPNGTIGRARTDSAIVRNIHRDMASLDSLFADLKKHPLRYIVF